MDYAIKQAKKAALEGEIPVGALVVLDGEIIASAYNQDIKNQDPTAHAEILAIRAACKKLGNHRLPDCDLYVTLEPCPMCCAAISFARIKRLYYGAADAKSGGVDYFNQANCHHKPEIYDGIAESECAELMRDFFKHLR